MKYSLQFTTITELEYKSKDELLRDIEDKMDFQCQDISMELKHCEKDIYQKGGVRYQRKNIGDCDEKLSSTMYYVIPENKNFMVYISCEEDSFRKAFFFQKVNNGKIRLGDNITLGKGRCKFFPTAEEEVIETVSYATGAFLKKNEYQTQKHTVHRELDDSYFVYHEKELDMSIVFHAHTDCGILIRDTQRRVYGDGYAGVVNKDNQPIIPASSWKGIFRNRITNYIEAKAQHGDMDLIDEMFGNREKGIKGCLIFYDSIIGNSEIINQKKAHINKFSGTLIGGIDKSYYVTGDFRVEIGCLSDIGKYAPYLITVIRDLHLQRINVGADMGTGKGFIRVKNGTFEVNNGKGAIIETEKTNDYFKPIKEYLTKRYAGEELTTRLSKIERIESRECNVALIGTYSVGKSSTINMLLGHDAASTNAAVTIDGCNSYKVNNFTFWDVAYAESEDITTSDLLSEINEASNGLNLVIIISDSSSVMGIDLFHLYDETRTVINSEKILFAINKKDLVDEDDVQMVIESFCKNMQEKYRDSVEPIMYSALSYKKDFSNSNVDSLQSITDFWLMIADGLSKSEADEWEWL